jgi:hypothetical protein
MNIIPHSEDVSNIKSVDDLADSLCESGERFRDFMIRRPEGSLIERYVSGHVCIALRRVEGFGGRASRSKQDGFVFQALNDPKAGYYHISALATDCAAFPDEIVNVNISDDQPFVLAQDVQLVEGRNGAIPSLVRFECFDRSLFDLGKPLFTFDACSRINHRLVGAKNWKVRFSVRILAIACCERSGKQIEGTPERVEDRANPCVVDQWKLGALTSYNRIASVLRIRLFDNLIRMRFAPIEQGVLEEWDLGYGPLNGGLSV